MHARDVTSAAGSCKFTVQKQFIIEIGLYFRVMRQTWENKCYILYVKLMIRWWWVRGSPAPRL